jgi:hypothetical protein
MMVTAMLMMLVFVQDQSVLMNLSTLMQRSPCFTSVCAVLNCRERKEGYTEVVEVHIAYMHTLTYMSRATLKL